MKYVRIIESSNYGGSSYGGYTRYIGRDQQHNISMEGTLDPFSCLPIDHHIMLISEIYKKSSLRIANHNNKS